VIMPSFTIVSCATAIVYAGATPVLVDADPRTWTMDVDEVAAKIGPRTRAIMPVHIYGHPCDMDPILELAGKHGLAVIEDAAEAHGAEYLCHRDTVASSWRRCGSFGDMSCFSFYANKLVTTGEGGMVVTDDQALAGKARSLRNLCFQPGRRFYHERLGFNFRMTNLQAALGLAQVERIDSIVAKKRAAAAEYACRLTPLGSRLQLPIEESWAKSVYWMYGVIVPESSGRNASWLAQQLKERGVDTRPFFTGMHVQPALRSRGLFQNERYPVTDRLAAQGLYLPSSVGLTADEIERVSEAVTAVLS